jgi:hypothetical protein
MKIWQGPCRRVEGIAWIGDFFLLLSVNRNHAKSAAQNTPSDLFLQAGKTLPVWSDLSIRFLGLSNPGDLLGEDQPHRSLEQEVIERPVDEHDQAVAETDEIKEMDH